MCTFGRELNFHKNVAWFLYFFTLFRCSFILGNMLIDQSLIKNYKMIDQSVCNYVPLVLILSEIKG